jgi:RNA polymerase sigma factor (sigma-70 family)
VPRIPCRTASRLGAADAQDAGQRVWLDLAEHLGNLRDPAALPGWLATTTRRECARLLRAAHRPQAAALVPDAHNIRDDQAQNAGQELLAAERHAALREAVTSLPPRYQQLITLLIHGPPMPCSQISATLGVPVGSIGPLRSRCLRQLRSHPAIAALINAETAAIAGRKIAPIAGPMTIPRSSTVCRSVFAGPSHVSPTKRGGSVIAAGFSAHPAADASAVNPMTSATGPAPATVAAMAAMSSTRRASPASKTVRRG